MLRTLVLLCCMLGAAWASMRTGKAVQAVACPNMCGSGGICIQQNGNSPSAVCSCFPGFYGLDCSLRLCPAGNAWVDFPSANDVAHGACSVGFQEMVNQIKVVANKPAVLSLHICGDAVERKKANMDVPLNPAPCVPNLYQKMLDGCDNVLMLLSVSSGKVHCVPKAGSLVVRFLLEDIQEEGIK